MADNKTTVLEDDVIDFFLRGNPGSAVVTPGSIFLALLTASPGEGGSVATEISTGGGSLYERQAIAFDAPGSGVTQNTSIVTFPTAGATWGLVAHFGITSADVEAVADVLYYGPFTTAKQIDTNDIFEVLAGQLSITEQ